MDRHQDYLALQDRAQEAESLLGHKIFGEAVRNLRTDLMLRLLALPVNDPKVMELHTKAKMLDELVGALRSFVNAVKTKRPAEE